MIFQAYFPGGTGEKTFELPLVGYYDVKIIDIVNFSNTGVKGVNAVISNTLYLPNTKYLSVNPAPDTERSLSSFMYSPKGYFIGGPIIFTFCVQKDCIFKNSYIPGHIHLKLMATGASAGDFNEFGASPPRGMTAASSFLIITFDFTPSEK